MIILNTNIQKDTVSHKIVVKQVTASDSLKVNPVQVRDTTRHKTILHQNITIDNSDTVSVCLRNIVSDVTFYDHSSFIFRIGKLQYKKFPYVFTDKVQQREAQDKETLIRQLKQGTDLPPQPLHPDWMIIIIMVAAFLYSIVRRESGKVSSGFARFFLFKGIKDTVSRDLGGLFYWQSTVLNLISFLVIGLFGYAAASYFGFIPDGFRGIVVWLIVLGIISLAVTLRHVTCLITGSASGQQEIFRDYLLAIYQSYRFGALFLFGIIILMSYTRILPVQDFIITGIIIVSVMYLIRVIRLLIIFLNRNISIFYLILYLCALEILPVLIIAKYFTGLV
jgi:hypothetical protein